jgi:hypothetical protein
MSFKGDASRNTCGGRAANFREHVRKLLSRFPQLFSTLRVFPCLLYFRAFLRYCQQPITHRMPAEAQDWWTPAGAK